MSCGLQNNENCKQHSATHGFSPSAERSIDLTSDAYGYDRVKYVEEILVT